MPRAVSTHVETALAPHGEEGAQQGRRRALGHTADHLGPVMRGGLVEDARPVLDPAALRVVGAEHQPADAKERDRRGAHRAGLERHPEVAVRQARLAPGRRNYNSFEINGELGSVVFNLKRLNELEVYFVDDDEDVQGFRKILVTDAAHPYVSAWWPGGHIIGWEHTFAHVIRDLMEGIKTGVNPQPSFEDGFKCQAVLDAVERSSESGRWEVPASS